MRRLIRTLALAGALAVAAAPAAVASPTAEEQRATAKALDDYRAGTFEPCKYTPEFLQLAVDGVTGDLRQYASDFPATLRDALAAHARGECDEPEPTPTPTPSPTVAASGPVTTPGAGAGPGSGSGSAISPTTKTAGTQSIVPDPPAPAALSQAIQPAGADPQLERAASASPGNGTPVPLIGLGVLSALALLTVMMLSALRRMGTTGGPLAPAYHSWREAQWRAGGVWEDFRDWLRTGR